MKKVYVLIDGTPAELLSINSADSAGKYNVHVKGEKTNRRVHDVGLRITKTAYDEYTVQPVKQPTKRSKK